MKKLLFALALSLVATAFSFPPEYRYIDIHPPYPTDPQEYVVLQDLGNAASLTIQYLKCGEVTGADATWLYPDALQNVPQDGDAFLEFKDFFATELLGFNLKAYRMVHDAGPCIYLAYKEGACCSIFLFTRDANRNFVKLTKEKFLDLVNQTFEPILAQPIEQLLFEQLPDHVPDTFSTEAQPSAPIEPAPPSIFSRASNFWDDVQSFTVDFFNDLLGEG